MIFIITYNIKLLEIEVFIMKDKVIRYIIIAMLLFIAVFLLIQLFFYKIIDIPISFLPLSHYENRSDLLTFINIIISSTISISVYLLSRRIDEQNKIEKSKKRYEDICTVYDFLINLISYTKKKVLKDNEDYISFSYSDKFLQAVFNLNNDLLDESDIALLRDINIAIKNFIDKSHKTERDVLSIKWVYKSIYDLSIPIDRIYKYVNVVDDDMLLNTQLVMILSKIRKELNYNFKKDIRVDSIILKIYSN